MTEYIYISENEVFLPWDIWLLTFGTEEELAIHADDHADPEKKELLYQKWLKDQRILSQVTKVDGEIVDTMYWVWD